MRRKFWTFIRIGENMKKGIILFIFAFILFQFSGFIHGAIPASERAALIALYNSTNGDNWINNSGWKTPPLHTDGFAMPGTEGSWFGVYLGDNVINLELPWNQLSGIIPPELGNLSNLRYLILHNNQLSGCIPPELSNLNNLKALQLNANQLSGSIPYNLGALSNLEVLYLSENQLSGSIPYQLSNLSKLRSLHLYVNQLSGSIPYTLGTLSNLEVLYLSENQLSGSIPYQLGNLSNLGHLTLGNNQLSGSIPSQLGNLSNLNTLYLNRNQLSGSIPSQLGNLSKLQSLYLDHNKLNGSIPSSLTNLIAITLLDVGYNCLYATDPTLRAWLDSHDPDWEAHQDECGGGTTPTVTTNSVSSITSNSAVCGGNVASDGGSTVTARGVCWSTSSNPTTSNSKTTDGTGTGSFTSYIYGLNPGTTYYVRAYATNSNGTSYGSNVSFTTNPATTTTPIVTTNSVSSITSTSAVCGGNVISDGGSTVTARGVCWSTSPNPTTSNSKTNDGSGTGSFTSYIYGLNPGTTYYVRAYATNSNGTSYGSNMIFTTNPASTPIADFYGIPTSGNAPLAVQFYDQSQPGEGASITIWYWDFGDGTTALVKNPTHTYNNPGIYDVKLTVQDSSGYEDSETKNDYIIVTSSSSTPTADFYGIPTSGSVPLTVQFYDQSIAGSGATITNWEWEFGDGSTSFHKNPTHTFTSEGTYNVKLSVTNSFGNSNSITKKNYVKACDNCSLYRLPFPNGINMKITNGYGIDYHINKDYYCVDFNLTGESDSGIPVLAVADGIVTYAKWNTGGYGFRVVVDHGNGITSNYSHGASINVREGEFVKQGQELMVIWDTGLSYGDHLHFGMREDGESMPLPQFSGCTNGCSFNPIEANGYTSDNVVNNPGKIIEESQADISGSFDGNEPYYGHDRKYSWKYAKEGTSTITLTYRPQFSNKVTCDIFVYIPPYNATTTAAKYKVNHVGGSETFTVNQLNVPADPSKPNNWVRLGNKTFEFGTGSYYYVQVGNGVDTFKKDDKVGFDAVYFKINESGGGGGGSTGTPKIGLNRTTFNFGAIASGPTSDNDTLFINNTGKGTLRWTAASNATWLNISPKSGTNSGTINISVNSSGLSAGTYNGKITISDANASNSPRTVSVNLKVHRWGLTGSPFGDFATPTDYSTVRSSIPVTGWALDDVGIESVKIYNGSNYIGDAVFVEGARPDIEQAYPGYPMNSKAGWGYMMLTNFLPNGGNGQYVIYARTTDKEGNSVTLGSKTIYCDNGNAFKPFGAIDTPNQGGAASGRSFINWGWVLTPRPNYIPTDGSTIKVYIDGVNIGHPLYNIYRADIANLFPGYSNSYGAIGYFYLDTTAYKNGVHTIQWVATDNAGNTDGIGSRYFIIQNSGNNGRQSLSTAQWTSVNESVDKRVSSIPADNFGPVIIGKGCNWDTMPQEIYPDEKGDIHIEIRELERVEIDLGCPQWRGYHVIEDQLRPLPVGSTLDTERGIFYWQPGPGFIGQYQLVFISREEENGELTKKTIKISIMPKFRE